MDKVYNSKVAESKWYKFWEESGFFTPKIDPKKKPFVIAMPPPNVTGELHLGHALTASIEDLLIRYHRMKGDPTLWIPGMDHAGIATQVVVEQELAREGKTRHDLGKELFLERVWQWVKKYGQRIDEQHKKLGVSADWSRRKFTLDPDYQEAVKEAFLRLKEKGLIYKARRMINWCSRCATVLSDLEVVYKEQEDPLYYIKYGPLTLATVRPETKFGDTALAVHLQDKRYQKYVNQTVEIEDVLGKSQIKVISDEVVDPDFGTGVIKVTPAHDPTDFEIGQRHNLEVRQVIDADGKLNEKAGRFKGLVVNEARKQVVGELQKKGLIEKIDENYSHSVGHCQRCDTTVEPMVSEQWFVKMEPLAKPAIEAVKKKQIKIIPKRFEKIYFQWLLHIKDWTISRQLWWGHQIPLEGEEDVLDTWFSSALWPFAILGWPSRTKGTRSKPSDYEYFYPTTVMETGYDILFFWVARMVMMGLEMTGKIPFETVYLHGLIRDPLGQKMSKSKGNVIEPLEMAEKYGTDALRMSLIMGNTPGKDMRLSESKIQGMRNFTNKLWNIGRFIIEFKPENSPSKIINHPDDQQILKQLKETAEKVTTAIEKYRFSDAAQVLYDFIWHEFADHYIEKSKDRRSEAQPTLEYVFKTCLELLHPFMPFITEELWQKLPHSGHSIIVSPWPSVAGSK